MNTVERLVHMANQIAKNFATESDPVAAMADHIKLFWDPRMKRMIGEYAGDGMSPVAAAAIRALFDGQVRGEQPSN